MRRAGFTLIEIMVAVLLLALLASAVTLSFGAPLRRARAAQAVDQIRSIDSAARQAARRFNRPMTLSIDLDSGELECRDSTRGGAAMFRAALPASHRIEEVRTPGQRVNGGGETLQISPGGYSRSYAIRLPGAWIMVSGLSGQLRVIDDENQIDSIFSALPPRNDAR